MKLEMLKIRGKVLVIIADYINNSRQKVQVGDCLSSERDVTSGVPHGSFLVYISNLSEVIEHTTCFGYADNYQLDCQQLY